MVLLPNNINQNLDKIGDNERCFFFFLKMNQREREKERKREREREKEKDKPPNKTDRWQNYVVETLIFGFFRISLKFFYPKVLLSVGKKERLKEKLGRGGRGEETGGKKRKKEKNCTLGSS